MKRCDSCYRETDALPKEGAVICAWCVARGVDIDRRVWWPRQRCSNCFVAMPDHTQDGIVLCDECLGSGITVEQVEKDRAADDAAYRHRLSLARLPFMGDWELFWPRLTEPLLTEQEREDELKETARQRAEFLLWFLDLP